jgi:hypothetical protein
VGNARKPVFLSPRPAKVNAKSPPSQRTLKYAFNLIDDGLGDRVTGGTRSVCVLRGPRAAA